MWSQILSVLILAFVAVIFAQAPTENQKDDVDGRIFLSTFTVVLSTVTSTTIVSTTTTCTTSSTAMSACSAPARRRRRGIVYDEEEKQGRHGLFYNEDEEEEKDGSSLSSRQFKRSTLPVEEALPSVTIDTTNLIPLTIQSGFSLPEGFAAGTPRFKLAYGTSTVTTTSTTTSTKSLTIFCSSITNYPTCTGSG